MPPDPERLGGGARAPPRSHVAVSPSLVLGAGPHAIWRGIHTVRAPGRVAGGATDSSLTRAAPRAWRLRQRERSALSNHPPNPASGRRALLSASRSPECGGRKRARLSSVAMGASPRSKRDGSCHAEGYVAGPECAGRNKWRRVGGRPRAKISRSASCGPVRCCACARGIAWSSAAGLQAGPFVCPGTGAGRPRSAMKRRCAASRTDAR